LVKAFLGWAAALALNGALSRRDHELLALRAAHNCCSEFEWAEHVEYAVSAGLTDDEIQRIRKGPHAAGWSPAEAALLTAADELHTEQRISDQTWAVLTPTYSPAALVELVYVVGQYTMLSMVAETFGVRP
jgi:alkylhydroperoxidase family enzyme